MEAHRKNHKFDKITDTCIRCGVKRRNISIIGNGYNFGLQNIFGSQYSKDGIKWSSVHINCIN